MATFQELQDDVAGWLNRQDIYSRIPGWTRIVETEIAETLRARCMVVSGTQAIDAPIIAMPPNFATMESIRDQQTGELLVLKDEWSGHYSSSTVGTYRANAPYMPSTQYRLVEKCVEFLPHPQIPNPPDPNWQPQIVLMRWYAKPTPLVNPADTNPVLEELYAVYLYGVIKQGAIFELDDDRAQQMDALWQQAITRGNLWKQQSDYSGAPLTAEMAVEF